MLRLRDLQTFFSTSNGCTIVGHTLYMAAYVLMSQVDTLFLLSRALLPFQLYISAKDTTSLLLVSTGMIFRSKYLFKNSSKFCYSLQEHLNPHDSGLWKVVNSISEVPASHVSEQR